MGNLRDLFTGAAQTGIEDADKARYLQQQGQQEQSNQRLGALLKGQAQQGDLAMIQKLNDQGLIPEGGGAKAGDVGVTKGYNMGDMQNRTDRNVARQALALTGEFNKQAMPYYKQQANSLESIDNLMKGTATSDDIASAGKAMIVHNGGQIPQQLISGFGPKGTASTVTAWLNGVSGAQQPVFNAEGRQALGDALWMDHDKNKGLGDSAIGRVAQQAPTLAPTLAQQPAMLQQHLGSLTNPNAAKEAEMRQKYSQWKQGQVKGLPGPGQSMPVGQQARSTLGRAADGLSDFFSGFGGGGKGGAATGAFPKKLKHADGRTATVSSPQEAQEAASEGFQ